MTVARFATSALLAVSSVSAFAPMIRCFASIHLLAANTGIRPTFIRSTAFHTSTTLHANVLKLSDPESELLSYIDVFIFDCDGVIWRVSHAIGGVLFISCQ